MTDEILYPLEEGTPEERLQPLMVMYWSEFGRWRFEVKWGDEVWRETGVPDINDLAGATVYRFRLVRIPRTVTLEIPVPEQVAVNPELPNVVTVWFDSNKKAQQFLDAIKGAE